MSAYGLGELPGTSVAEAADMILGETGDLVHLPQLPGRGLGSDAVGRTATLLEGIHVDRGPRSWIMSARPQIETRRSRDLVERDLEVCAEVWNMKANTIKVQVAGPWMLAAQIEMSNGHKVITDRGAMRDLTDSLIAGIRAHLAHVAHSLDVLASPQALYSELVDPVVVLQIDEPLLPKINAGKILGTTEFENIPAVAENDIAERLNQVIESVRGGGVSSVLLNQTGYSPLWEVARESGADTVQLSLDLVRGNEHLDGFGRAISEGVRLGLGITNPGDQVDELGEKPRALAVRVARFFDEIGLDRALLGSAVDIHPRGGITTGTLNDAAAAYRMARVVAGMLESDAGDL
ncbi:hypothetical protein COCCU_05900 [Corynebacterium occultum]|uniref:Methionine synthase n=1 Tax=Corynebacterium occultum TaxID=2675219 RepID=A0A6B8W0S8_9CORY|nr:hypothetical protein [Corynebacterium occultum]QGU07124.1 hypothetical protein COCCU_05900 [Corynebacterium occultum]